MKCLLILVGIHAWLVAPLAAQSGLPYLNDQVVDEAEVLSEYSQTQLIEDLTGLEDRTGVRLVVMTAATLRGSSPESFAEEMLARWKKSETDSPHWAIMLLLPEQRTFVFHLDATLDQENYRGRDDAYWFEKGEVPPSYRSHLKSVLSSVVKPHFKEDDWSGGFVAALNALEKMLGDSAHTKNSPAQQES